MNAYTRKELSKAIQAGEAINFPRVSSYIQNNIRKTVWTFCFEENNEATWSRVRDEVGKTITCLDNIGLVDDWAIVCDGENNTPPRINRGELWVDVALQFKATVSVTETPEDYRPDSFVFIPVRLRPCHEVPCPSEDASYEANPLKETHYGKESRD